MMRRPVVPFIALLLGLTAGLAWSEQVVFVDFGDPNAERGKANTNIYKANGEVLGTLNKGQRRGFRPTDIGHANNDNRDAIIQKILDQVKRDFAEYNIRFVKAAPGSGDFSTISVVAGKYPDLKMANGRLVLDIPNNRLKFSRFYIDLKDGKAYKNNGDRYPEKDNAEFKQFKPTHELGQAQRDDKCNKTKNDGAWVLLGEFPSQTTEKNQRELANTISHELGHLVGLEHGAKGSIMGGVNNDNYGTDKEFSDEDKKKLKAKFAPKGDNRIPRSREGGSGDRDQYGTSEPDAPNGDPDHDDEQEIKEALVFAEQHTAAFPFPFKLAYVRATSHEDGAFTDRLLPRGTRATYSLHMGSLGIKDTLYGAWLELDVMNVADVLGRAADFKVFVDGQELRGALDGLDQRVNDPELPGRALGHRVTLFLDDHLGPAQIESALADGILEVVLEVDGATPFVAVDHVAAYVVDALGPTIPVFPPWGAAAVAGVLSAIGLAALRRGRPGGRATHP